MAGFQDQLKKEIEKRQLNEPLEKEPVLQNSNTHKKFSYRTFFLGLFLNFIVLSLIGFWAFINANDTSLALSKTLSSKTVLIDKADDIIIKPIVEEREVTPVIAVPPNQTAPVTETSNENKLEDLPTQLVQAPIPGLYETGENGLLPIIRKKDGLTPFDAYKKPFAPVPEKPIISFVINNTGLSKTKTTKLIDSLNENITFSFSPYANYLKEMVDMARADNHEVWLSLPLENETFPIHDSGPYTLLKNVSEKQNQDRLNKLLSSANGYVGFITNQDHIFDAETTKTSPTINNIYTRGLTIFDSKQSSAHFNKILADKYDSSYGVADLWLDNDLTPIAINRQIRKMIELATVKGNIVVMLNDYPASINALNKFLASSAAKQFQLAPLSYQVKYVE